jgi:hypothetical protein
MIRFLYARYWRAVERALRRRLRGNDCHAQTT